MLNSPLIELRCARPIRRCRPNRPPSELALGNEQALAFPIDVIEGQRGDLPGAQSVGDEQEQHREVALAERTTTVHALEHQSDVVATDRPRHAGQAVHAWRLDRSGQVARDRAFPVGIAHQHPHRAAHSSHAGLAHTRANLGHEGAENGRGEFGEALHTDANQKGFEDSKVVTVVGYRCLAQTSFLTQVREEARCLGQERIACDPCPTPSHKRRDQKGDELFDRAPRALPTTASASSAATGFSPCRPVSNKGLDVLGEPFEGPGTTTPCELCELPQNRNPWPDIARRIALARQRRDVAFDGSASQLLRIWSTVSGLRKYCSNMTTSSPVDGREDHHESKGTRYVPLDARSSCETRTLGGHGHIIRAGT